MNLLDIEYLVLLKRVLVIVITLKVNLIMNVLSLFQVGVLILKVVIYLQIAYSMEVIYGL